MIRLHHAVLALFLVSGIFLGQIVFAQTLKTRPTNPKPVSAPACATVLPTEDTVNSFLFQMFGYDPSYTWKIADIRPSEVTGLAEVGVIISSPKGSSANRLLVTPDGKHVISGEILPFGAKPFDDAREKLEKGVSGPAKGPAKAPVMLVEFSDLQCPHCKEAAPGIEQLLAQEPDAHFVFQNFPLPAHNWAEKAAEYVDCVGQGSAGGDAVWKFIQKAYDEQTNITESNADEKLKAIVTASGAKADEVAACVAKPDTKARVEASVALGRSVGVNGTPSLFINGRMVSANAPVDTLKKIVDFEASLAKGDGKEEKGDK
jgi:protein-disulfide isomerase